MLASVTKANMRPVANVSKAAKNAQHTNFTTLKLLEGLLPFRRLIYSYANIIANIF